MELRRGPSALIRRHCLRNQSRRVPPEPCLSTWLSRSRFGRLKPRRRRDAEVSRSGVLEVMDQETEGCNMSVLLEKRLFGKPLPALLRGQSAKPAHAAVVKIANAAPVDLARELAAVPATHRIVPAAVISAPAATIAATATTTLNNISFFIELSSLAISTRRSRSKSFFDLGSENVL